MNYSYYKHSIIDRYKSSLYEIFTVLRAKWKTTLFCFLSFDQFEEEEENTILVNLIQYCSLFVDVLPLGVVLGMLL